jgi:hypothetical protein
MSRGLRNDLLHSHVLVVIPAEAAMNSPFHSFNKQSADRFGN